MGRLARGRPRRDGRRPAPAGRRLPRPPHRLAGRPPPPGPAPRLFELVGPSPMVGSLGGLTLLGIRPRRAGAAQRAAKRAIDIAVSTALLALTAPLLAALVAAIRLEDGGPALFHQERIGRRGRRFRIVKLRTMRQLPVAGGAPVIDLPIAGATIEALVASIK